MAYNYYQPYGNNYYPQYNSAMATSQPQQTIQTTTDDRIWVSSDASAEAYPIMPNGFLRLWDSNQPVFYEKRADASGKPYPMVTYEYKVKENLPNSTPTQANDKYEERITKIEEKIARLEESTKKKNNVAKKEEIEE